MATFSLTVGKVVYETNQQAANMHLFHTYSRMCAWSFEALDRVKRTLPRAEEQNLVKAWIEHRTSTWLKVSLCTKSV